MVKRHPPPSTFSAAGADITKERVLHLAFGGATHGPQET